MSTPKELSNASKCACGSTRKYIQCCGQYIKRGELPASAETLMRSRYTAYVLQDAGYLLKTWHASTRPTELNLQDDNIVWNNLEVIASKHGTISDTEGQVEFIALFSRDGCRQKIHEVSRFVKEDNHWFYLDAVVE